MYEAILLVNRGVDEGNHGLERLMRLKDSRLSLNYLDRRRALFEEQRAQLNAYFCNSIEHGEELDAARFERQYVQYRNRSLDEVQVHRDVLSVEEQRRAEGKPPRVRFLSEEERQRWGRQHLESSSPVEGGH